MSLFEVAYRRYQALGLKGREGASVSRRNFMKGFIIGAATVGGVAILLQRVSEILMHRKWDKVMDVVVIGFGCAGAAAAIEAHDAGAEVILLEKESEPGGSTAICGGVIYAADTSFQKEYGVQDSPDEMFKYWMATGKGLNDPELVRVIADRSSENVDWLMGLGAKAVFFGFSGAEFLPEFAAATPPKPRGIKFEGEGAGLFKILNNAVLERKIEVLLETKAIELIVNTKREVIGVKAEGKGEELYICAKKGVIITTGGFGHNREMLKDYSPKGYKSISVNPPCNTGDGIRMARALGADLRVMHETIGVPGTEVPRLRRGVPVVAPSAGIDLPAIFVDKNGKRFVDESLYYDYLNEVFLDQEVAFLIFDDNVRKIGGSGVIQGIKFGMSMIALGFTNEMDDEIKGGVVLQASTIRGLAMKIGVDPTELENTVEIFNENAKSGVDPEFGRARGLGLIKTPPFYAIETRPAFFDTMGGVSINVKAQVLDVFNETIPRLYAAGRTTGGAIGEVYPGSGSDIQEGTCFGRIAGRNAAAEESWF
ncbi:MAG: flavocytochrome c [Methanocellales archaeon]|nr:flavocytochrome c [Methanocellales archaeon]MDD3291184.1 flavocytochrome c [Methanocellales archaeon]MDD5235284.1 flavocytochrome c [Methanocellales archaeon]MDD5484560.1 flavocytochrome c [Methanocellales archaeon]